MASQDTSLNFNKYERVAFLKHQTLKMLTRKRHAFKHLSKTLTRDGEIESLCTRAYEVSHKQLKAMDALSRQRKRFDKNDVAAMQNNNSRETFDTISNLS